MKEAFGELKEEGAKLVVALTHMEEVFHLKPIII